MANQWPLSSALTVNGKPIKLVSAQGATHPLFDIDDVKTALGGTRFALLTNGTKWVAQVYCVNHRIWGNDHPEPNKRGAEVHCIAANELEAFLRAGN